MAARRSRMNATFFVNASGGTNLSLPDAEFLPPSLPPLPQPPPLPLHPPPQPPAPPPIVPLTSKLVLAAEAELALLVCGIAVVCCMMLIPPCVVVYKRWRRQREQQQLIDEHFSGWRRGGPL